MLATNGSGPDRAERGPARPKSPARRTRPPTSEGGPDPAERRLTLVGPVWKVSRDRTRQEQPCKQEAETARPRRERRGETGRRGPLAEKPRRPRRPPPARHPSGSSSSGGWVWQGPHSFRVAVRCGLRSGLGFFPGLCAVRYRSGRWNSRCILLALKTGVKPSFSGGSVICLGTKCSVRSGMLAFTVRLIAESASVGVAFW